MNTTPDDNNATEDRPAAVVKKIKRIYSGLFNLEEALVSHPRFDGSRQTVKRLSLERGDSVAMILVDRHRKKVWLTEQFRYPTMKKGPGWVTEIPAGGTRVGEAPEESILREVAEETGFAPDFVSHVATFYISPGGTSERVILYYAEVDGTHRDIEFTRMSCDKEEDIRVIDCDLNEFMEDARLGELEDAKTLIAGLWLCANRDRLEL